MAELIIVDGEGAGAAYALGTAAETTIGRDPKCTIALHSGNVSTRHSRVYHREGNWVLEDCGSTNGTFVNGRKVTRTVLAAGDTIKIGSFAIEFRAEPRERTGEGQRRSAAPPPAGAPAASPATARAEGAAEAPAASEALVEATRRLNRSSKRIVEQMGKVIVGQAQAIEDLLLALFARGHVLLVGVPGLAKTLMVRTLAGILDLSFKRVQFTPDLMPADITGTEILEEDPATRARRAKFLRGPIFANILLADEINRTPPKTQAALLEAMQEYRVTAAGTTYDLPLPFFVLATQNPIEQEGTYPLPEAQLDRFMFNCIITYPSRLEEVAILRTTTIAEPPKPQKVLGAEDILACQQLVRALPVSDYVLVYAADLARASRPGQPGAPDYVDRFVAWGAGPRAAQCLVLGAKARALLHGRLNVSIQDVKSVAHIVLRHRIFLNFHADAEGLTAEALIDRLLGTVAEPSAGDLEQVAS